MSEKIKIEHLQDLKTRVTSLMVQCDNADHDEYDLYRAMFTFIADLDHAIAKLSQRKIKGTGHDE